MTTTIHFQKATMTIIDGNIVRIHVKDGEEIGVEESEEIYRKRKELIGDKPYYVLLVHGKHSTVSNEARKMAAEPEYALYRKGFAMVVTSLAQRLIGNFYINFEKPPSPTRLFTDEKKAMQWLNAVRKADSIEVVQNKVA